MELSLGVALSDTRSPATAVTVEEVVLPFVAVAVPPLDASSLAVVTLMVRVFRLKSARIETVLAGIVNLLSEPICTSPVITTHLSNSYLFASFDAAVSVTSCPCFGVAGLPEAMPQSLLLTTTASARLCLRK